MTAVIVLDIITVKIVSFLKIKMIGMDKNKERIFNSKNKSLPWALLVG